MEDMESTLHFNCKIDQDKAPHIYSQKGNTSFDLKWLYLNSN